MIILIISQFSIINLQQIETINHMQSCNEIISIKKSWQKIGCYLLQIQLKTK